MKALLLTLLHLTVMTATLCGPGGVRAVIAENLLLKQQLIVLRRPRRRAPRLTASDRLLFGFGSLFLSPGRIRKVAIGVRPATLLACHQALGRRTYRRLFSSSECPKQPGPKGPSEALIQAIVELTSRNPRFGCPRSARIISRTFGANIDKNVVCRVLSTHYRPIPGGTGPSWVSFIGHTTDSLWSVDLFRGESIVLRSYWVLVVMDQCTRRLVGALLHESDLARAGGWNPAPPLGVVARIVIGPHEAHRQDSYLPMRYDTGRPRAVIRFKISQPRTTSLPCPAGLRARRPSPMMDLYRKNVFSTRP